MRKFFDFILKPFGAQLPFFLTLWILASMADLLGWIKNGDYIFAAYLALHGYVICYLCTLICGLFKENSTALKVYKILLLVLGIINLIADTFCYNVCQNGFTNSTVALILDTNMEEATGMLDMYMTHSVICPVVIGVALVILILLIRNLIVKMARFWLRCVMLIALLLVSVTTIVRKSGNYNGVFLCKVGLFLSYDRPKDLDVFRTEPELIIESHQPAAVVLIIGEALAKNHCSLYGYEKQTQPLLEAMRDSSSLLVYNNVQSAVQWTVPSFITLMTEARADDVNGSEWRNMTFLMDLMKSAGYKSYWLTNQPLKGLVDNAVSKFAFLADSVYCSRGENKVDYYDDFVLPVIAGIKDSLEKQFFVIHQMGSHEHFKDRSPQEFRRFTASDYQEYATHSFSLSKRETISGQVTGLDEKLQTLADYDNSILFNDYVVTSIMHSFDDTEAVVFYFPDHGMDIFVTDETYAGHSRENVPESMALGKEIPFVVYMTQKYLELNADKVSLFKQNVNTDFCTEDMIYTLTDVAGATIAGNDNVNDYSLIRK